MPVSLTRLRIAGFKSFAEPVVVEIHPGLTGIVGPNGCGKSNVVEALRWAMGEASARSLRGGEMDDVIFAGTNHRASRNIAEVTIALDDALGLAPPPFDQFAELEIARRIERNAGSTFRVNGREARARDVQTLFADLATGARSSAMVSQGRVSAIVGASPAERRNILEEAAGISGLHARRHEAELKLRATEANLARAQDLRAQLDGQLEGLQRQAKQAARFRTLAESLKASEAELLALERARADHERAVAVESLARAEAQVAALTAAAAEAARAAAERTGALPSLRERDTEARTALERVRIAGEQAMAEAARAADALATARRRVEEAARDLAHAERQQREAADSLDRLASEAERLSVEEADHPARLAASEQNAATAASTLQAAEAAAQTATEHAAETSARHRAALDAERAAQQRLTRAREQATRLRDQHRLAATQCIAPAVVTAAVAERDMAETGLAQAVRNLEQAEAARSAAQRALAAAREQASAADSKRARLAASAQGLTESLATGAREGGVGLVDQIEVPPGMEAALGAALGDALDAGVDPGAPRHWAELPPLAPPPPALPDCAEALDVLVQAPAALGRALAVAGLVASADGDMLQAALTPGQVLVSREGGMWRWDGFRLRPGAPTSTATRLQQRNRLVALRHELAAAEAEAAQARDARLAAETAEREAVAADVTARSARKAAEARLERARAEASRVTQQAGAASARLEAFAEQLAQAEAALAEAETVADAARAVLDRLPDPTLMRQEAERARAALAAARARDAAARSELESLVRAGTTRTLRRTALLTEREAQETRAREAAGRHADLAARVDALKADVEALADAPAACEARRVAAQCEVNAAEARLREAAARLQREEAEAALADRRAREAEQSLAAAREHRVAAEAEATRAGQAWGVVAERILGRFGITPDLPAVPAPPDGEAEERVRRRVERLTRERDSMGPVNLRAELEATAIEEQIAGIVRESGDLETAIAKLRGSIGHINREGRERLAQVFADIDRHFQALFERMFGGGRAHLALVGSDDPLQAGLEIYAQPPGKKLATLSLLSGGEQALTALSLIFAVFRCNPAPICVLDEVDAPLDDTNVERFCSLLATMVAETGTRFLVVTHHHLTMARMDRLYGVTMQERGVSRLLSVDLTRAAAMVEQQPVPMAAE